MRLTFDQVVCSFRRTFADLCLVSGNDLFLPLEQRAPEGVSLLGQVSSLINPDALRAASYSLGERTARTRRLSVNGQMNRFYFRAILR